jgi:3-carboxy-cis,cis-muconate cycloisomerase
MPTVHTPFTPARLVQAMLDVEAALADACAEAGAIPAASADAIRAAARADVYDVATLQAQSEAAGNLLIPLVAALRARVAQADPVAAGHVHWGATSQDVIDTATVLQIRLVVADVVRRFAGAADAAAELAQRHARTPIAGRTWLQQATPTTFGAKAATWLDGLERVRVRLAAAGEAAAVVQLGGAVGTQASIGEHAAAVTAALARRLGLAVPDVAWHTERSRVVDVACALGLVCGVAGKIGRDVALLAQTEVAEVAEASAPGRGGSSSMPHKRNPVGAARAISASVRAPGLVATMLSAMPQEHERALGGWQAEWDALPGLVDAALDASSAVSEVLSGLQVDAARMHANLDLAGGVARAEGLVVALAPHLGRSESHGVVERACRRAGATGATLAAVAADDAAIARHLDAAAIRAALDPAGWADAGAAVVARVLRRWRPGSVMSGAR